MHKPLAIKFIIGLDLFAAVSVVLYWATWHFSPEIIQARSVDAYDYNIYVIFEQAFPLADSWFAIAVLLGAVGLWKMRHWEFLFSLLAGSAAIFLGLMDLLYDLQHNMFIPLTSESIIELIIVLLLIILSPLKIYILWRHRRVFFTSNQ